MRTYACGLYKEIYGKETFGDCQCISLAWASQSSLRGTGERCSFEPHQVPHRTPRQRVLLLPQNKEGFLKDCRIELRFSRNFLYCIALWVHSNSMPFLLFAAGTRSHLPSDVPLKDLLCSSFSPEGDIWWKLLRSTGDFTGVTLIHPRMVWSLKMVPLGHLFLCL